MLKKFLPFLFISILFFTSCVSSNVTRREFITPDNSAFISLLDNVILEDDIFSWNGENKSLLIRSWGIPTNILNINDHETLIEYIISETVEKVHTEGNSVSNYNEILEKTFTKSFSNETHTNSTTETKISFYVVDDIIEEVSYNGYYYQMRKLCKGRSSKDYGFCARNADGLKTILTTYKATWLDLSTEEIFMYVLPLSNWYGNEYFENIYLSEEEAIKDLCKDYDKEKWNWGLEYTGNDLSNKSSVLGFVARIKLYRELFEDEVFDTSIYFKDKYSIEDFTSGAVKWNEVPLEYLQPLKRYTNPTQTYLYRTNQDLRTEALNIILKASKIETEQDYINQLNLMNKYQTENTIFSYILQIENFYELYPDNLNKIQEPQPVAPKTTTTKNESPKSTGKYTFDDIKNCTVMWSDISLEDIQALEPYANSTVVNLFKNKPDLKKKTIEDQMTISNIKTKQEFFKFITDFQNYGIDESTLYVFIMYIEYYYNMK